MAEIRVPVKRMTFQEFLDWCNEDVWAEWVRGEVIELSPASRRHQELLDFLVKVLGIFVEARDLGILLPAPFSMKLEPTQSAREPDLLFVARDHEDRLKNTYLDGPADLVVEIVSPESRLRDRGEKFAEYELGGVQEYWLLDPTEQRADFYLLGPDGRYERCRIDEQGIYRSTVLPDFPLSVSWLWQQPLPRVLDILRQLQLI